MSGEEVLKDAGLVRFPKYAIWVDRQRRMAFRDKDVHDSRNTRCLADCLESKVREDWFRFYNSEDPPGKCFEILTELGLSMLRPEKRMVTVFLG